MNEGRALVVSQGMEVPEVSFVPTKALPKYIHIAILARQCVVCQTKDWLVIICQSGQSLVEISRREFCPSKTTHVLEFAFISLER